ncbi:MAG: DNA polymerase domain-containing protein [Candidatus Aenigmatarchaeota archaeon]
MEIIFQLLDVDYIILENRPIIRLLGKTEEGKTVCAFYDGFYPYFYVLPKEGMEEKVIAELKKQFNGDIKNIEKVEKFLPIGFQEEKKEMLKITLKDPSKTANLREHLRKQDFVEDVFEADILFKYRFMADFSLFGMNWYKIYGTPTHTQTTKADQIVRMERIEPFEKIENAPLKFMALDIEVVSEGSINPLENPIAIISMSFFPAFNGKNTLVLVARNNIKKIDHDVLTFDNEKKMLEKFLEIIEKFNPDIILGYNINDFDLPYINERLAVNKLKRTIGRCNEKPLSSRRLAENRYKNSVFGRVIVDPYWMIKDMAARGFFVGLKRFGLGDVSNYLLGEGKIEFSHTDMTIAWNGKEEDMKRFIEYARKDSELVLRLLLEKQLLDKYIGISKVSGLLLQDSLDTGEAGKVENLLLREFDKDDFVLPCKPSEKEIARRKAERDVKGFKGAFVLEPEVGLHTTCIAYLDFASMYPSIFITYNICPTTLLTEKKDNIEAITTPFGTSFLPPKIRKGIIPRTLERLIKERNIIKTQMKIEKDPVKKRALDAYQEGLKRIANASYGYTGFILGRIYVLNIANAITSCGRYFIQETKRLVETNTKYKVIYGDTDSVMIKTDTQDIDKAIEIGNNIANFLNEKFEGKLKIKVENIFKTLLILTKKRYAGWSFEKIDSGYKDEIVMKGIETVRRDWCDLVSETQEAVLDILLKEQNPKKAFTYFKEVVQKLQNGQIPLEKLVIIKGISKRPDQYKGVQPHVELVKKMKKRGESEIPSIGDRIGFVIVKGAQMISERAEDPEYVKKHGLKIDSRYYIESQLLPPLERVFEAVGIAKAELVGLGRQMLLGEIINNHKKTEEKPISQIEGMICIKCNTSFRRAPLIGRCTNCGGELEFYFGEARSKTFSFNL